MRVIGIDPGSRKTGYAFFDVTSNGIVHVYSGILDLSHKVTIVERILLLRQEFQKILDEFHPTVASLESLIYVQNPLSLIKLAEIRGALLAYLVPFCGQEIYQYSPNEVKLALTGHGHANKQVIQQHLQGGWGLTDFLSHDQSDACAIALCHIFQYHQPHSLPYPKRARVKRTTLADSLQHKILED